MKKLLNIAAAALASTMLFVGCSNGVAEPEKADDGVKVIDNEIDLEGYLTDLGWYPTFTMAGSDMLGVTEKNAKITFTYQMDEGAEYTQFGVYYDNLYDDSGSTTEEHTLEKWKVYDGKIYNEKGVAQTLNKDYVQISQAEPIVLYINLTEAQGKAFAKRGMVIQGENCTLTGLTISYEGEVIIERNVKDFAKATGTVTGSKNTKLMLNPDNANETVIGIIGIKNTESSNAVYKFEEPTDFTGLSRVRITARSGYKYGLNSDKTDVEKKSTYINGWEADTYATYINWDAAFKTNDSSNQLFFKTYNEDNTVKNESEWVPAKIKDFYPDYTDPDALAYGLNDYSADNGEKLNSDAVFLQEGKEYSKWCMRYVLTEKCDNVQTATEKRVHVGHKEGGYLTVTLFTDDNTSSTITVKDDVPAEFTEVPLAFKDFTKIADDVKDSKTGKVITKGKKVDLKKVTGIKIETGESSGDLYIKAINFDF